MEKFLWGKHWNKKKIIAKSKTMHVYIYDEFLAKRKYEGLLANIETRITDLGMNGKIIRLGNMKNTISLLENDLRQGIKTVVAVGDNGTVNKVLNKIIQQQDLRGLNFGVPIGIIPIEKKNNSIAFSLGIKNEEDACAVLSARRIEKLDLGKIENVNSSGQKSFLKYFLSEISVPGLGIRAEIDKKYSVELLGNGELNVFNLSDQVLDKNQKLNPQDGKMELVVKNKKSKKIGFSKQLEKSVFSFTNLVITSYATGQPKETQKIHITIDHSLQTNLPVEITILKKKIDIIVGKNRSF